MGHNEPCSSINDRVDQEGLTSDDGQLLNSSRHVPFRANSARPTVLHRTLVGAPVIENVEEQFGNRYPRQTSNLDQSLKTCTNCIRRTIELTEGQLKFRQL
jgi:hypothetical protein